MVTSQGMFKRRYQFKNQNSSNWSSFHDRRGRTCHAWEPAWAPHGVGVGDRKTAGSCRGRVWGCTVSGRDGAVILVSQQDCGHCVSLLVVSGRPARAMCGLVPGPAPTHEDGPGRTVVRGGHHRGEQSPDSHLVPRGFCVWLRKP